MAKRPKLLDFETEDRQRLIPAVSDWATERAQLKAECELAKQLLAETEEAAAIALERLVASAVARVRAETGADIHRLQQAVERLMEAEVTWDAERARLTADCDAAQQLLADSEQAAALAVECERARMAEAARVDGLIQAISELMNDSETELSVVIRKGAERAQLESYLSGLRFSSAAQSDFVINEP